MASAILERDTRDPLSGMTVQQLEDELRQRLSGRVEAAYVFGSFATATLGPQSDVDLILVTRTQRPFVERPRDFEDLLDLVPRIDMLVYTPEEFEQLTRDPSPGFWRSVTASLRRLI